MMALSQGIPTPELLHDSTALLPEQKLEFYRQMFLIRQFEETALDLFKRGFLNGTVHTCIGQEPCAVGVVNAMDRQRDCFFSNHRGHGHFLAYSDDFEGLLAELMGKKTGVCGGVGGSQHLHVRNFYSNGIQGGIVPVAAGIALAEKFQGTGAISVVFIGDGTMGEGVIYEVMNVAATWDLPLLIVVENNRYAQTTPLQTAHAFPLAWRPGAFGVKTFQASGFSLESVHSAATVAAGYIRCSGSPACLVLETYRLAAHSKGDDTRDPAEVREYLERDPLMQCRNSLDPEAVAQIDAASEMPRCAPRIRLGPGRNHAKGDRALNPIAQRLCVKRRVGCPGSC